MATHRRVSRCADAQIVPVEHEREHQVVITAEDGEVVGCLGEDAQRAFVEGRHRCLHPDDVRRVGKLEEPVGFEQPAGAGGDVVGDDRNGALARDLLEVRHDPRLTRAHVIGNDAQRGGGALHLGERLDRSDRGRGVVGAGADDHVRGVLTTDARTDVDHRALLAGIEKR